MPGVGHDEVLSEAGGGLRRWLEDIERYGFGLVRGVPATPEATRNLIERIGYVRHTIFGGFWDFTANLAFKDTAYTTLAVGPHTDGTYSIDPPGYQMFHCLAFDGTGGESTLVDGFKAAAILRDDDTEAFETLTRVRVPAHYIGDGVHLRAEHPVITLDADGEIRQVAFNNHDRAPFLLPDGEMDAFYRALGGLQSPGQRPGAGAGVPAAAGDGPAVRQLARAARPPRLQRPAPAVRRLPQQGRL